MENSERNWMSNVIGTAERQSLAPKEVVVKDVSDADVPSKKRPGTTYKKIILKCKHPDRAELLEISDVKIIDHDKVAKSSLWYFTDNDGKIQKDSALAKLLDFCGVSSVGGLKGKTLKTVEDGRFLVLRAY